MSKPQYSTGIIIICVGAAILLGKLGLFSGFSEQLWPLFLLIPGLLFHLLYFSRLFPSGMLIPGGILTTYSVMFFYCNIFGWESMSYLWPGFILAVGIGLYEYYLFDHHHPKGAMIAASVLGTIAAVFFAFSLLFTAGVYIIAFALIALGGILLLNGRRRF